MGAGPAGGTGVEDPGQGLLIQQQPVAVTVDQGTGAWKTVAQPFVALPRRGLVAVDHDQITARQGHLDPTRELAQGRPVRGGSLGRAIVVATRRPHGAAPRLQSGDDRGCSRAMTAALPISPQ